MRAALIIDHVAGMSRMMERGYEFGDGEIGEDDEEEMEDGDGDGDGDANEDDAGDAVEEVAREDPESPFVEGVSGSLEVEKDEKEGSGREVGGDEDGDSDGEKEDEDSHSSWMKRGVSFSAGARCTPYTESGGS